MISIDSVTEDFITVISKMQHFLLVISGGQQHQPNGGCWEKTEVLGDKLPFPRCRISCVHLAFSHPNISSTNLPLGVGGMSDCFSALSSHPHTKWFRVSCTCMFKLLMTWLFHCCVPLLSCWWCRGVRCMAGWLSLPLTIGIKNYFECLCNCYLSLLSSLIDPFPSQIIV